MVDMFYFHSPRQASLQDRPRTDTLNTDFDVDGERHVVQLTCPRCKTLGDHRDNCDYDRLLPIKLSTTEGGKTAHKALCKYGMTFDNSSTKKNTFRCANHVFLSIERKWHRNRDGTCEWVLSPVELEVDSLEKLSSFVAAVCSFRREADKDRIGPAFVRYFEETPVTQTVLQLSGATLVDNIRRQADRQGDAGATQNDNNSKTTNRRTGDAAATQPDIVINEHRSPSEGRIRHATNVRSPGQDTGFDPAELIQAMTESVKQSMKEYVRSELSKQNKTPKDSDNDSDPERDNRGRGRGRSYRSRSRESHTRDRHRFPSRSHTSVSSSDLHASGAASPLLHCDRLAKAYNQGDGKAYDSLAVM